jgi:hypothetical protein
LNQVSGGNAVQDPFASTRWVTKRMSSWMIPDGDVVSVTGGDSLFALMALANDALPNEDDRKLTVTDVAVLRILMELISESEPSAIRLHALATALHDKLSALLPPS